MRYLLSINPLVLLAVAPLSTVAALCTTPSAEICDDAFDNDLDGYTDCGDTDCAGGFEILINEIQYHPAKATDVDGEYVELYNYGNRCVSLEGWTVIDDSGLPPSKLPAGAPIPPGGYYVVTGTSDAAKSCVSAANAAFSYDMTFNDTCDSIVVKDAAGTVRAQVNYCNGSNGWPSCPDGTSMEYCNIATPTSNNSGGSWQCSVASYGCGDLGTPNLSNSGCLF